MIDCVASGEMLISPRVREALQVPVLPRLLLVSDGKAPQVWPRRSSAEAFLFEFVGKHQLLSQLGG
jgi:hypothetical protein